MEFYAYLHLRKSPNEVISDKKNVSKTEVRKSVSTEGSVVQTLFLHSTASAEFFGAHLSCYYGSDKSIVVALSVVCLTLITRFGVLLTHLKLQTQKQSMLLRGVDCSVHILNSIKLLN